MKKIENRRTDKKNAYIMGIKGKLYVAIGIIVALTISMGAISWHLFQTSSTMIGEITKKTVPAMLAAAKVSTNTAQLNEEIPNIASVKNVEELKQTYTALKSYINKQKELVDGIKIVKHDQKLAALVLEKTHQIDKELEKIYQVMHSVLGDRQKLEEKVTSLLTTLNKFEHEVTVLVDDAFFDLIIGVEERKKLGAQNSSDYLLEHAEALTSILEVKAEGNLTAGLLGIASQHNEVEKLIPLYERFQASIGQLQTQLETLHEFEIEKYKNLSIVVTDMILLGDNEKDIFDLRQDILKKEQMFEQIYEIIKFIAREIDRAEEKLVSDILNRVDISTGEANQQLATGRLIMIYGAIISVVFSFLIGWLYIGQNIIRRMTQLGHSMLYIARGEFSQQIPSGGNDEITEMADAVEIFKQNMMENQQLTKELQVAIEKAESAKEQLALMNVELEQRVEERTKELTEANGYLQKTLTDLQLIQEELVEAEKMASLGRLVAGISHEINTPVGNAVTAASTLRERMQNLYKQHQGGDLSKRKFEDFITSGQKISELILDNLKRAAKLVTTFKQISIDEGTFEEQKPFNVSEHLNLLINEVLVHFKTNYDISIDLDCPKDLDIVSYPSALLDVMQNLISDSVIHGFKESKKGKIKIVCHYAEDALKIDYQDDGCGMDEETLNKLFDPFFTTNRSHGGSGLGMHIVYNIIVKKLKGKIKCQSTKNKGTQYLIQIPVALG